MTSRERVLTSLNHEEPDRVPLDIGGSPVTGMHITCVEKLRNHYGLAKEPVKLIEPFQCLGFVEPDLAQAMGTDVDGIFNETTMMGSRNADWKEWRTPWGQTVLVGADFKMTTDGRGNTFFHPGGDVSAGPSAVMPEGGWFFDAIRRQPPLPGDDADPDPGDNLEEFGVVSDAALAYLKPGIESAVRADRAVFAFIGGTALGDIALVPGIALKQPKGIRDVAEWYISTVTRPSYIRTVFERQIETGLRSLARLEAAYGDDIDILLVCGTDFGTQSSTFCSPQTFRNLYLPFYRKVNDWIHANTGWKTFKHCCGSIPTLLPMFIEAGFDIVNPVQTSAAGMDPTLLKREFGRDIVFWGGGVDTQRTLPFGSPAEVREEVLGRLDIFAPGGGFVFTSIHNIQAGTPTENIVAMIDAVGAYGG